jgi:hypothetical protein
VAIKQVFSAYVFYNDSHNGPGLASLYLPNGVDDHGYNNGAGEILPSFGIGGNGCVLRGTQQIATYISHVYGDTAIYRSLATPIMLSQACWCESSVMTR